MILELEKQPHNHESPFSLSVGQRLAIVLIAIIALWGAVFWALQTVSV